MRPTTKSNSWVLWLTAAFVLVAVAVFAFALIRHRQRRAATASAEVLPAEQQPAQHSGEFRVVRVADGDTLTLMGSDGIELTVRLRGIDAPELGQPYGYEAKEALQRIVQSANVRLDEPTKEKYGRYLANVFAGELWINKAMIQSGDAWCDQVNAFDRSLYSTEREARDAKRGLWSTTNPTPPWIWRAEAK
jgi:endonuclease YncB( thermonuclease family)